MANLSFRFDWLDGAGIRGPELAATFASLEIRVGAVALTQVLDHSAHAVRNRIFVPLYPLAESLASNWWFHGGESRWPTGPERHEFHQRHSLVNGGDGFVFPDLIVIPTGERLHLRWFSSTTEDLEISRTQFLARGEERVETTEFRDRCARLIEAVLQRLEAAGIRDTYLHEEWATIRSANTEEVEFCETAAGLGWDPYDLDEDLRAIVQEMQALGGLRSEALPAVPPENAADSCAAIKRALSEAPGGGSTLRGVPALRQRAGLLPKHEEPAVPWLAGYDRARRLRRGLGIEETPLPTMKALLEALDQDRGALDHPGAADFGPARMIDGLVTRNGGETPTLLFRPMRDEGRRFVFCRALSEALAEAPGDTLLTATRTDRQQRNRAFAAEFLAPATALRKRISRPLLQEEDISDLAAAFGVSPLVIIHQVANHDLAETVWPTVSPTDPS